jgi:hypothetical protein
LIVEGIASRAGVFDYARADGSIQKELRLPEDVFATPAMSGYQGATITKGHPAVPVTAHNAKRFAVGTVLEPARRDGDHVRVKMVVQDAQAIDALKSKRMRALSTGYSVDLEETPGNHPVYGRYDAIQRRLVINHLALCEDGRAGPVARVRIDANGHRFGERPASWSTGWRADAGMMTPAGGAEGDFYMGGSSMKEPTGGGADMLLTSVEDGHQHTIDADDYDNDAQDGSTSYATSEGADSGHMHQYIRSADGTYTITMNEGHTHTVLPAETPTTRASATQPTTDSRNSHTRGRKMTTAANRNTNPGAGGAQNARPAARPESPARAKRIDEDRGLLLGQAGAELARERKRAEEAIAALAAETARADAAEGALEATVAKLEEAEANQRDDDATAEKDDMIERLTRMVEDLTAQRDDALKPDRVTAAAKARVKIVTAAMPILGYDKDDRERMDSLSDRDLMLAVITKRQGEDCTDKPDAYVQARFDVAVKNYSAGSREIDKLRESLAPVIAAHRGDNVKNGRQKYLETQQNGWKPENRTGTPTKGA